MTKEIKIIFLYNLLDKYTSSHHYSKHLVYDINLRLYEMDQMQRQKFEFINAGLSISEYVRQ